MQTVGAQPKLALTRIRKFSIPLPPTKAEQEAIALALSDADALIESLEQPITKKRHIKQGAIQELLIGKKHLPGFSGKWEVKRLGDVADIDPDNLNSATPANYNFNYISLEDVDLGSLRSYSEQVFYSAPFTGTTSFKDRRHFSFHGAPKSPVAPIVRFGRTKLDLFNWFFRGPMQDARSGPLLH